MYVGHHGTMKYGVYICPCGLHERIIKESVQNYFKESAQIISSATFSVLLVDFHRGLLHTSSLFVRFVPFANRVARVCACETARMAPLSARARRSRALRVSQRSCLMLVAARYRKTWALIPQQRGFRTFETMASGLDAVEAAAIRAAELQSEGSGGGTLVFAPVSGDADGSVVFDDGDSPMSLFGVLEAVLPLFQGRIHFHTSQLGNALNGALCAYLNSRAALKHRLVEALGEEGHVWRVSGFVQDITELRRRDGTCGISSFDKYLQDVSRIHAAFTPQHAPLAPHLAFLSHPSAGARAGVCAAAQRANREPAVGRRAKEAGPAANGEPSVDPLLLQLPLISTAAAERQSLPLCKAGLALLSDCGDSSLDVFRRMYVHENLRQAMTRHRCGRP
jgi:hypothetical protein